MPQRILVVDDDSSVLQLLEKKLDLAGFDVWLALSAQDALGLIRQRGLPHLAIVDIRMPGMDGFAFCRTVQAYSDLPIVMLTAVEAKSEIVAAIEQYAEDYVTKPFDPDELIARVRRVLRRIGDFAYTLAPIIPVDDRLAIDFARQMAHVEGRPVPLSPTETRLLYILMGNAGRIVKTDFLLRRLWPDEEVFEDTLRVHVHRLRAKIEPDPAQPRYLLNERGVGYRFVPRP